MIKSLNNVKKKLVLTWQCYVSDHFGIFVHIDMWAEYALIEGKKWKTIVASKIFYTETSSNGLGSKIADESSYQVCEL